VNIIIQEGYMSEINIGDVVRLKSGGPSMTVKDKGDYSPLGPNPGVRCTWFDGKNKKEDTFHEDTVEIHNENSH
jgi:uncharacterized protein YodC (DUF2158 family)